MLRETLDLAKLLWSGDPRKKVSYEGKYVRVTDIFLNPQPVQRPRPPILIGGGGEQLTLRVVARHADIWHGFGDPTTLTRKIGLIDEYARGYGRDPARSSSRPTSASGSATLPDEVVASGCTRSNGRPADQLRAGVHPGRAGGDRGAAARAGRRWASATSSSAAVSPALVDNWRRISDEVIPRFANG